MTEFHEEVPVSGYGAARRQAWLAHHAANAAMAERAAVEAHGQTEDHRVVQAGQAGLFGHMSPEDRGASVQARAATVGQDYGGRPLERLGGILDHGAVGCSPAPARVDLRSANEHPGYRRGGQ